MVFNVEGDCGTGGLIVVEADWFYGRLTITNQAALLAPPATGQLSVDEQYNGNACPYTLDRGEWTSPTATARCPRMRIRCRSATETAAWTPAPMPPRPLTPAPRAMPACHRRRVARAATVNADAALESDGLWFTCQSRSSHRPLSFEADGAAMTLSGSCRSIAGALVLATFVALAMTGCDDVPCSGEEAIHRERERFLRRDAATVHAQPIWLQHLSPESEPAIPACPRTVRWVLTRDRCARVDSSCTATCRCFGSATHSVSTIDWSCRASTATMRRCVRRSSPSQHSDARDGFDARAAILKSPTNSPMRSSW